jgi:hypothetical protein
MAAAAYPASPAGRPRIGCAEAVRGRGRGASPRSPATEVAEVRGVGDGVFAAGAASGATHRRGAAAAARGHPGAPPVAAPRPGPGRPPRA